MTTPHVEIFRARNRQYGWRVLGANGRKVMTAGETFATAWKAGRAARRAAQILTGAIRDVRVAASTTLRAPRQRGRASRPLVRRNARRGSSHRRGRP